MKFLSALIPALMTGLGTLFGKVIAAFGFSIVTYVGLESLISVFKDKISSSVHGVPAGLLQMFYISGGGVVLNIFFGCLTFILTFKALTKLVPSGKKG